MSASSLTAPAPAAHVGGEEKRVLAATLVGTAIEWYDYFIYAQAAGLVLGPLFFAPIARENAGLAQILSFATIGISFLFRPLGALICGDLGDRFGRKAVLVATLVLMGASTMLIGLSADLRSDWRLGAHRPDPAAHRAGFLGGRRVGRRRADGG